MTLHQLNLAFDAAQDRLLLRASTTNAQEFRFWLTRRLVARLWPRLIEVLKADMSSTDSQPASSVRASLLEFQHAAAIEKTDLQTPYSSAPKTAALGEQPLLATQLSLRSIDASHYELSLSAPGGAQVNLALGTPVLHGLLKLLQDAARSAEWGLALTLPATPVASASIN